MTDPRDDPRYVRTAGLTLLAALLVVASCQVEQLSNTVKVEQTTPGAVAEAVEEPPPTPPQVELPPTTDEMERLRAAVDEAIAEARRANTSEPPPLTDDGAADLAREPVFTPMTVRPELRNRGEVQAALMREYPPSLRDAGIGGTVEVWFFITEEGLVQDTRISQSSGQTQLDEAALRVADILRFTPAMNRSEPVAVWIQLPISFQAVR